MDTYEVFLEKLKKCEIIKESDVKAICTKVKEIFELEENVHQVPAPCTIVGDIHGQFFDLLELFLVGGDIPDANYVFMGDFVDRGYHSVESFLFLLVVKILHPKHVALVRGNHESRQITQVYGFYDECLRKYGNPNVWRYCTEVFDFLPLASVVEQRILCVHAGLSPSIRSLKQLNELERRTEVPHEGAMCDLLWSDPEVMEGWGISPRGAGYLFGGDVVAQFNEVNQLELICRSHQLVMEGYKTMFQDTLVTVWSAPNYCYRCGNVASILELDENLKKNFKIFDCAPEEVGESGNLPVMPPYFL